MEHVKTIGIIGAGLSGLVTAKTCYNNLIKFKPNTEYKSKADEKLTRIDVELQKFNK